VRNGGYDSNEVLPPCRCYNLDQGSGTAVLMAIVDHARGQGISLGQTGTFGIWSGYLDVRGQCRWTIKLAAPSTRALNGRAGVDITPLQQSRPSNLRLGASAFNLFGRFDLGRLAGTYCPFLIRSSLLLKQAVSKRQKAKHVRSSLATGDGLTHSKSRGRTARIEEVAWLSVKPQDKAEETSRRFEGYGLVLVATGG